MMMMMMIGGIIFEKVVKTVVVENGVQVGFGKKGTMTMMMMMVVALTMGVKIGVWFFERRVLEEGDLKRMVE